MSNIEKKLARLDLNLLVSLSVLLKTRNVSRAAEELYLSQSAMSRTLQRLRETFDDPLFHRTSKGITPTVRALELAPLLPTLLSSIENIIEKDNFTPETSDKTFSISVPPLLSSAIMPKLLTSILKDAPNIIIHEHPTKLDPLLDLESGGFDFTFYLEKLAQPNLCNDELGDIKPVIYARKNHPLTKLTNISIQDCLEHNFVELLISNDGASSLEHPVANILFGSSKHRNIVYKSNQLINLIELVKNNDYLMVGGSTAGVSITLSNDIESIYEFKVPKNKQIKLYLISHQRVSNSDAHQWLRNKIIELIS